MSEDDDRKIYSVSDLTRQLKATLERTFPAIWIEGELSNVRIPASGHCYFTIKDAQSQIPAVMFRGNQRGMSFRPADGIKVRAYGAISVYEARGSYQIIVRVLEETGLGALQLRFEKLKLKLQQEGLFDAARKRPLPLLPRCIGVVTSDTGAAIRDILNVLTRRFPNVHLILAPSKVQGDGAAEEIAEAIDRLNAYGGVDVIISGRGGGSLEDLWPFNEEVVARAIHRSATPVISAVGHEIDFTISDFVADLRAPTPSAAAELVVGCKEQFEESLRAMTRRLAAATRERLHRAARQLADLRGRSVFQEPAHAVARHRSRLESCRVRLGHCAENLVRQGHLRRDDMAMRMAHVVERRLERGRADLQRRQDQLDALNPRAVLSRGFTLTRDGSGRLLHHAGEAAAGATLITEFCDGRVESVVGGQAAVPPKPRRPRKPSTTAPPPELELGL